MPKEQLAIFLLNLSKESLSDFLNELRLVDKSHNLTKNEMIELIINCDVINNNNNAINLITNDTEKIRTDNKTKQLQIKIAYTSSKQYI